MLHVSATRAKQKPGALFDTEPAHYPLPALTRNSIEDAFDEIELLGFPLCDPFMLLATSERGNAVADEFGTKVGNIVTIVGYVVTTKDSRTRKGESMYFGTFLDKNGVVFDTVHFPQVAKRFPFRGRGFYLLYGKVVEEFGVTILQVESMKKMPIVNKRAEQFMQEDLLPHAKPHPTMPEPAV